MSVPLTINGAVFNYPVNFDTGWGIDATGWAQAVTSGMLQKAGGIFTLTADVDFGASFGLKSAYFETRTTHPATAGTVRLASADTGIAFRDNANATNLVLTTNSSDNLTWPKSLVLQNAAALKLQDSGSSHTISIQSPSVATNYSLVVPPNGGLNGQFLQTDGTGVSTWANAAGSGTVNSGTAGHLTLYPASGTTISDTYVQNTKNIVVAIASQPTRSVNLTLTIPNPGDAVSGDTFALLSNSQTFAGINTFQGGAGTITLSGSSTIAMGNNKITGLSAGTTAGDSVRYEQTILTSGANPFVANQSMGNNKLTSVTDPTSAQDAATKNYVDTLGSVVQQNITAQAIGSSNTVVNITSISLTAGRWLISALFNAEPNGTTWSSVSMGISTTNASLSGLQLGYNLATTSFANSSTTPTDVMMTIPAYYVTPGSTTVYYLNAKVIFSAGSSAQSAGASLVAVRIGF